MAGEVSGSSGLGGPQRRIGGGERPKRMNRKNGREPKIGFQRIISDFDRRCDVIAVATAVMMRIPFVTIGGHLIGVAGRMAQGYFVHASFVR